MFDGDSVRGCGVRGVVAGDFPNAGDRLFHRSVSKQAFSHGKEAAETGVLSQDRLAAGEIADASIADPAALRLYVHVFGDHEFSCRVADESLIPPGVAGNSLGINQQPAIAFQKTAVAAVGRMNMERDLEALPRQSRQHRQLTYIVHTQAVP